LLDQLSTLKRNLEGTKLQSHLKQSALRDLETKERLD